MALLLTSLLLKVVVVLFLCHILGAGLINFTRLRQANERFFITFLSLVIGQMVLATAVAVYATQFKTILLGFLIIIGLLLYYFKKPIDKVSFGWTGMFPPALLVLCCAGVVLCLLATASLFSGTNFMFFFPWRDPIFYSVVSNQIFNTGIENFDIATTLGGFNSTGPAPYHYFELWLNAAISELFGGLYFHNYMFVTAVVMRVAVMAGFLAIWEFIFKRVNWVGILVCFFFLYLEGITFDFYKQVERFPNMDLLQINTNGIKFLPGYIFFLGFAVSFLRKEWLLGILLLLGFPIAHIVSAPGVFGALGVLGVIAWFLDYKQKKFNKSLYTRFLIGFFLVAGYIVIFYLLTGSKEQGSRNQNVFLLLSNLDVNVLRTSFNAFVGNGIRIVIILFPFLLGLVLINLYGRINLVWNSLKNSSVGFIGLFVASAFFIGALISGILFENIESHQLIQILSPFINVLLGILLMLTIKAGLQVQHSARRFAVFAGIFLLMLFSTKPVSVFYPFVGQGKVSNFPYDHYSDAYLLRIKRIIETNRFNSVGGCILGPKDLDYFYAYSPNYFTLGIYLPFVVNDFFVLSMSEYYSPTPKDPLMAKRAKDLTSAGAFYKFVSLQQQTGRYESIEKSQIDFIRKHNFDFVIVSPNAPENQLLNRMVKYEVKDKNTGERFVILEK